jgi:hypothetical protein
MSQSAVLEVLRLNTGLFEKGLSGIEPKDATRRVVEGANPYVWIAGHLASARFGMASFLGQPLPPPWGTVFAKGAKPDEVSQFPSLEEILARWREVSLVLDERLLKATPEQLAAPSPRAFPIGDKSLLGGLTFLTYHEGYHLGQMAMIRKTLGLSRLVDA